MKVAGKIIWITGASSGIGRAMAISAANRGAAGLILSSRNESELKKVAQLCSPVKCLVVPLDMNQHQLFDDCVNQVINEFGRIDILVNNAGISQRSNVLETPEKVDRAIMELDYFSQIFLSKKVLSYMLEKKSGHFVIMSSLSGLFGFYERSAYCAAKHALHGFFEALRLEYHDQGIGVTIACPGFVKTKISLNALNKNGEKHGVMDENQEKGVSPEYCSNKIWNATESNKKLVLIGKKEILMAYFKRYLPGLFYKLAFNLKRKSNS